MLSLYEEQLYQCVHNCMMKHQMLSKALIFKPTKRVACTDDGKTHNLQKFCIAILSVSDQLE